MPGYPNPYTKPPESLADHIRDLANAFASAAGVLSTQYTDLNKATKGLLNGTYPWKGQASNSFFNAWHGIGNYMQALQKSCEDTHNALAKFADKLDDIERQQAWDAFLTVVGGIMTVVSVAAAVAEWGANLGVDGIAGFFTTFTEREGSDMMNVAEDISQADSEAATELEKVEEDMTSSPALTGPDPEKPGSVPDAISPASLDEVTLKAYDDVTNMTSAKWGQWVDDYTFDYSPDGSLEGTGGSNPCSPSVAKMLLEDNRQPDQILPTDQQIENAIGYTPTEGAYPQNLANGLRQLGLRNATYNPNMTETELRNETNAGRPVIVGLNLNTDPTTRGLGHAIIVDKFTWTDFGEMVCIRDPFFNPPRAYMMPLWAFQRVWQYGGITY